MKLHILGDIHLEFAPFALPDTDADVVVMAGDIGVGLAGIEWANRCAKPVVYVAGNHEYYGHAIPKLTDRMRSAAGSNVAFLENDEVVIDGVRFLGATLWTDFRLFGDAQFDHGMVVAGQSMNDFRKIRCSPRYGRLTPRVTEVMHRRTRFWLQRMLQSQHAGPTVVVTHHAPSIRSISAEYRDDPLASAFASNVEELADGTRISLWVHGHTHHCIDYPIAGTRVVSNQRGYPGEETGFDPTLVVDVAEGPS